MISIYLEIIIKEKIFQPQGNDLVGFKVGQSKDETITPKNEAGKENKYAKGWRVLSKNDDGTVNIIHAGTPMAFSFPQSIHNSSGLRFTIDAFGVWKWWRMYEDTTTDSVDTSYAIERSAHSVTKNEILGIAQNSDLRAIGVQYHYYYQISAGSPYYMLRSIFYSGTDHETSLDSIGVRPVVTLKANIKVKPAS